MLNATLQKKFYDVQSKFFSIEEAETGKKFNKFEFNVNSQVLEQKHKG